MPGRTVDFLRTAQVGRRTAYHMQQLGEFGKGVLSDFAHVWASIIWFGESFAQTSRARKLNEMRRLLAVNRIGLHAPSTAIWDVVRHASISLVGGLHAFTLLLSGAQIGVVWMFLIVPIPILTIDWQGKRRAFNEQIALALWFLDRRRPVFAYKLADQYKEKWGRDIDGRYRKIPLQHIELSELQMLRAEAAFRSRRHPLHSVVQAAKKSLAHGSRWTHDGDIEDSLVRFVVIQTRLGNLLFEVAKKWPDKTAETAPFLNRDNKHVLKLASDCLQGALECASGNDAYQAPKIRKVMERHGLLAA